MSNPFLFAKNVAALAQPKRMDYVLWADLVGNGYCPLCSSFTDIYPQPMSGDL